MLLYQRALAIPTESILLGNLQAETGSWQEHIATAMAAGPLFLGDLRKQSPDDSGHMHGWIVRYNRLRGVVRITDSFFPPWAVGSSPALISGTGTRGLPEAVEA